MRRAYDIGHVDEWIERWIMYDPIADRSLACSVLPTHPFTHALTHQKHEWEAVSRALGTGHCAIQCLREYQRRTALQEQGGGLYKRGGWTVDEDARLAEAVGMYADNWTLISQHVQSRTAAQCRFRCVRAGGRA